MTDQPVDTIRFGIEFIVSQFIIDKQGNQQGTGDSYGKSGHIYESEELMFSQIPEGYGKVVSEHTRQFRYLLNRTHKF
jgi:hypothetical protein